MGITAAALLPAITLPGCRTGAEEKDAEEDGDCADEDGDDDDPEVNPGADELEGDTLDNDCDLAIDCEDADLTGVGGDLLLLQHDELTSISGLARLETVGGNLSIGERWCEWTDPWECTGTGNSALVSLDGLQNLATVGGWPFIADNDALETLDGLGALTTLDTDLWLAFNPVLPSPLGLDALVEVKGTPGTADDGFTTMAGPSGLQCVGGPLEVWDHAALVSLEGRESLESVGPWFTIITNDAMGTVDGAPLSTDIGGSLQIPPAAEEQAHDLLVDLSGLYGREVVTGNVLLVGNPVLTDDEAWARVAGTETIGGVVKVVANG